MTQDPNLTLMSAILSMNVYDEDIIYADPQIFKAIDGKNIGNAFIIATNYTDETTQL